MRTFKFWYLVSLAAATLLTPLLVAAQQAPAKPDPAPPKLEKLEESEPPSIKVGKPEEKDKITETRGANGATEVKVHTDGHVVYKNVLYSVPFTLVGKQLWLKATDTVVQLFHRHELVATHARKRKPGDRSTVRDHQPPEAQAWLEHDPQWCLARAKAIGRLNICGYQSHQFFAGQRNRVRAN